MTLPPPRGWPDHYEEAARAAGHASWAAWVLKLEGEVGRPICGRMLRAKAKHPGTPCTKGEGEGVRHIKGAKGACKHHGGQTPRGKDAGGYKTGKYSRYLQSAPRYLQNAAEKISKLRDLWSELDLMRARVAALITVDAEHPTTPAALTEAIEKAIDGADNATTAEQLREAAKAFADALAPAKMELESWTESVALMEPIRKLFETQMKTEQAAFAPMSEVREYFLLENIKRIVSEFVPEERRAMVAQEFAKLQVEFIRPGEGN